VHSGWVVPNAGASGGSKRASDCKQEQYGCSPKLGLQGGASFASPVAFDGCLCMPHANTRYWTIPLTVLLFVNTVLVALAARQVGIAGEQRKSFAEAVLSVVAPVAANEPNRDDASSAAEYTTTEDWPTADDPVSPERPEIPRDVLIVINPPTTGGMVHFLLDGAVVSLAPGELARVLAKGSRLVQFHRGDDFGNEELRAESGVFAFAVSDRGWTLAEAEDRVAADLLQICRPVTPATLANEPSDDHGEF
jgi:hypothetical protein